MAEHGRGKMWDIVEEDNDIESIATTLINYVEDNNLESKEISNWYKENCFIEPTESNICNAFELYD